MTELKLPTRIVTDALGFELKVQIIVGEFDRLGSHKTFEHWATKLVDPSSPHKIEVKSGLDAPTAAMVAAHEAYHLFASIKHLITCDEETETETFGELVKTIFKMATQI